MLRSKKLKQDMPAKSITTNKRTAVILIRTREMVTKVKMILVRDRHLKVGRVQMPRFPTNVILLGMRYNASDVLELTDDYRLAEIKDAEKRIKQAQRDYDALLEDIFRQYKKT